MYIHLYTVGNIFIYGSQCNTDVWYYRIAILTKKDCKISECTVYRSEPFSIYIVNF